MTQRRSRGQRSIRRGAWVRWLATVIVIALHGAGRAAAADPARAILDRRKALEDGAWHWNDRHQRMHMAITAAGGRRERELDVYERHYPNDEVKAVVFLRAPADVRDVAFLAIGKQGGAAEQWLYLPSTKRVRKITVSTRDEPFVSSDLTFHDLDLLAEMPSWTESDAAATLRGEETIDATPCDVIALKVQRADIGYPRVVLWLGRDLVPRQLEFYAESQDGGWLGGIIGAGNRDDKPLKRIRQSSIVAAGAIPIARRIDIETVAKGSHTAVDILAVDIDRGLPEDLFTQRALENGPPAAIDARP